MYGNQAKAATTTTTDLYYTISKICAEKLSTTNHQHGWYHTFIDCDLYSRHRCTCWRLLLLQCITGFLPIAWVKSELSLSQILKCLSGFFLLITQAILTSFWLEEFRFCTTECEVYSGLVGLPSAWKLDNFMIILMSSFRRSDTSICHAEFLCTSVGPERLFL